MPILTLRHFILKQQVFDFYRTAIRATRAIPHPQARRETVRWIRGEIERNRYLTNEDAIEDKLKMARRDLKQILPGNTSL